MLKLKETKCNGLSKNKYPCISWGEEYELDHISVPLEQPYRDMLSPQMHVRLVLGGCEPSAIG